MKSNKDKKKFLDLVVLLILACALIGAFILLKSAFRGPAVVPGSQFTSSGLTGSDYVFDVEQDLRALDLKTLGKEAGL